MASKDATIVIDDYHRASPKLSTFVEHLYTKGYSGRLIAISRRRPTGFWKKVLVVIVPPLSRKEAKVFSELHKLDFDEVWRYTRGHPGFF